MEIRPVRSKADHEWALGRIEALWDSRDTVSDSADELDVLITLVQAWESQHEAILPPDPLEAIAFRLEQLGLGRSDLTPILSSRSRVSEVLARRRPLTLAMIRRLRDGLGLSADVLVGDKGACDLLVDQLTTHTMNCGAIIAPSAFADVSDSPVQFIGSWRKLARVMGQRDQSHGECATSGARSGLVASACGMRRTPLRSSRSAARDLTAGGRFWPARGGFCGLRQVLWDWLAGRYETASMRLGAWRADNPLEISRIWVWPGQLGTS